MRRFVLVLPLVVASSACGLSPEDARATWSSVQRSLGGGGSSTSQALSVEIGVEADCEEGGSMELDARLGIGEGEDFVPEGADAAFAYEIRYDECQPDENTLNGQLDYVAAVTTEADEGSASVQVVYVYRGEIHVSGEENGTCVIDMRGSVDASAVGGPGDEFQAGVDVRYEGTLCGQDASEVLSVSVSSDDGDFPSDRP